VFTRDFTYDAEIITPARPVSTDEWARPIGSQARRRPLSTSDRIFHLSSHKLKGVKRWKHEGILDAMQPRLDRMPGAMSIRRQTD
jgi:hypothetical protein